MSVASLIDRHGRTVTIERKDTDTIDAAGGRVEAWGTTATTQTAMIQVRSNSDAIAGGAERPARLATIYFDGKPALHVSDRVAYDSSTWSVRSFRILDERSTSDALCYTIVEAVEVFG